MTDRKISALSALTDMSGSDYFPLIDASSSDDATKNRRATYSTLLRSMPNGSASTPSCGWLSDSGETGFYRTAANEIGVTTNQTYIGKFTSAGFQLGTGTATGQLHLFSADTSDQVVIENNSADADSAPDLTLYRNSASPATSDILGAIQLRGEDSAGNSCNYASIRGEIVTTTNGSEDGALDLMSVASGTLASRIRLRNQFVGIHQTTPIYPLDVLTATGGTCLNLECSNNDAATGADLTLFHRRGASGAGQASDILSTIWFRGKNAAGTPAATDFASIRATIIDASGGTEDGRLEFNVLTGGSLNTLIRLDSGNLSLGAANKTITIADTANLVFDTSTGSKIGTATGQKIGFWNATPVDQPTAVSDLAHSTSSGTLPTPDGTVNISNAASPTNAELLAYCCELEERIEILLSRIRETGLIAT